MDAAERLQVFFAPLESKEALRLWLKAFLNLELPDEIVDEESTSTALDFVWLVYQAMQTSQGPKRFVVAVSRNGGKTLCACIIRFLGMIHFRRSGTHLAANLEQSASATMYLEKFLEVKEILPYIKTNNTRAKELRNLPPNSWTTLSTCSVRIATATIKGVNSQRGSLNTRDEVDLVDQAILSEAAYIADPTPEGLPPVEINLSSRKSNSGPIQRLIDEAESGDTSISLQKWSTVDWMQRCPVEQSKADLPPVHASINTETLKVYWSSEEVGLLPETEKQIARSVPCYEGCKTCPAFLACLGRSVKRKSRRGRLRNAQFVGNVLKEVRDPANIIAQTLNWKPELSGIVFRIFNKRTHYKKAAEFFRWCIGRYWMPSDYTTAELAALVKSEDPMDKLRLSVIDLSQEEVEKCVRSGDPIKLALLSPSKRAIYRALRKAGWYIHYGIDWGTIDPAVCLVIAYHKPTRRVVVLHCEAMTGFANEDWAKYVAAKVWPEMPCDLVCPDMADINSPVYFGRLPERIACRDQKPARIEPGVSQIRALLWNPMTQHEHFCLLDDGDLGMNKWVAECLEKWSYKKTPMGYDFKHFEDNEYTHPLDALRYGADPWIADQMVHMKAAQPKPDVPTEVSAAMGDVQSMEIVRQRQELKNQMTEYFSSEHGLANVFAAEERAAAAKQVDAQRGWSPLKADPATFVPPPKDPLKADELPEKPNKKIIFKF
jgi:hypothetical protein